MKIASFALLAAGIIGAALLGIVARYSEPSSALYYAWLLIWLGLLAWTMVLAAVFRRSRGSGLAASFGLGLATVALLFGYAARNLVGAESALGDGQAGFTWSGLVLGSGLLFFLATAFGVVCVLVSAILDSWLISRGRRIPL